MRHKLIKLKSCRKQKSCNNLKQKFRKDVVLVAIFCFAYLKVKDTNYIILSDRFEFSTHQLCINERDKKYRFNIAEQSLMFHISTQDRYTHFQKLFRLKISMQCAMYKSKNHTVLGIYTSGFRKHRSNIYMTNNYVLLSRFH